MAGYSIIQMMTLQRYLWQGSVCATKICFVDINHCPCGANRVKRTRMVKPSAGASNKGRLFISALTLFSQYLLNKDNAYVP